MCLVVLLTGRFMFFLQMMKTLIPLYASLVAALTFGVHADVGSYMLEALAVKLIDVR